MGSTLIVVWFEANSLSVAGFEGRDEIEDPLDEALTASGLGCVNGGGSGFRGTNIDVDIDHEKDTAEAIVVIKRVLQELNAPVQTTITIHRADNLLETSLAFWDNPIDDATWNDF